MNGWSHETTKLHSYLFYSIGQFIVIEVVVLNIYYDSNREDKCCGTPIQVDSDHTLQGGVQPDVRVPLTEESARAMYIEGRDVVLEFAERFLQEEE